MAKVIVINIDGSKSTKSTDELVEMAKSGLITHDTELEFNGRKVRASKIRELKSLFEQNNTSDAATSSTEPPPIISSPRTSDATVVVPAIELGALNSVHEAQHELPACPVQSEPTSIHTTRVNYFAIVALILGVINVFVGSSSVLCSFRYVKSTVETDSLPVTKYDLKGAAFGADFYTATYAGLDVIVDVLDETNTRNAQLLDATRQLQASTSDSTQHLISTIYRIGGLIVVALGLTLIGGSLIFLKRF